MSKRLAILGIRGIPASHGGFETFAERLAVYLTAQGWDVTVYCQTEGSGRLHEDSWHGIRRVIIPVKGEGTLATIIFDLRSVVHSLRSSSLCLTLGYNTAIFSLLYRLKRHKNIMNMDGIEWQRDKWPWYAKLWLYINERLGCHFAHHLIADHPQIKNHLIRHCREQKITVIPYGADTIEVAEESALRSLGLHSGEYFLVIARPEPENSILEIVEAFCSSSRRYPLLVLGHLDGQNNPYHRRILQAASPQVHFPGAIYDKAFLASLRFHARVYIHGHTVGGTNPSLVEALGAGNPILAQDNVFNRWVAGEAALYFSGTEELAQHLSTLEEDDARCQQLALAARNQHRQYFTWERVLTQYQDLLTKWSR